MTLLKKWLDYVLHLNFDEIREFGYCSMVQLFYNNHNDTNTNIVTISKFE